MEYGPKNPFESYKKPDEAGSAETSKKKKKRTTKVPLSDYLKTEVEERQPTSENVLERLFEKAEKDKKDEQEAAGDTLETEDQQTVENTENILMSNSEGIENSEVKSDLLDNEAKLETDEIQPSVQSESLASDNLEEISLEGEFASEMPLIITRAGVPSTEQPTEIAKEEPTTTNFEEAEQHLGAKPSETFYQPEMYEALESDGYAYEEQENFYENYNQETKAVYTKPEKVVTKKESDNHAYQAEKHGVRKGVLAGGLFGWWIGRRGKKEAIKSAKQAKAEIAKRDEEIERLEFEQTASKERVSAIQHTQNYIEKAINKIAGSPESFEKGQPQQAATKEVKPKNTELSPEDREITEESYIVKKGRRIETSAWHSVEIDEKTGKAVSDPERAYGKEFVNEQKQEKLRTAKSDPGLAVQFGHTTMQTFDNHRSHPAQIKTEPIVKKLSISKKQLSYVKNQLISKINEPSTWLIAFGVFILLFVFGIMN